MQAARSGLGHKLSVVIETMQSLRSTGDWLNLVGQVQGAGTSNRGSINPAQHWKKLWQACSLVASKA